MNRMTTSTYRRFTGWVTQLARETKADPLIAARLRSTLIFAAFCTFSFFFVGYLVDEHTRRVFLAAASGAYSYEAAMENIADVRMVARIFHVFFTAVVIYVVLGLSFRPVQRAIEAQREFVAKVAHEFRTPLAVAKTETEVALKTRDSLTKEEAVELLEAHLVRINHLSRVMQFLLVLSDLSAPRSRSFKHSVCVPSVIRTVVEHRQDEARKRGISLEVSLDEGQAVITGNAIALEKMLDNLVRNALAHTPEGGRVRIGLAREQRGPLTLTVEDTGSGIPPAERRKVFDAFYRAQNAASGGSGLGLAIVQEIARVHGAKVEASESPLGGALLKVTFAERSYPHIPRKIY